MADTKVRNVKTPAERLADLNALVEGASLKREELDAQVSMAKIRIRKLLQAHPELGEAAAPVPSSDEG